MINALTRRKAIAPFALLDVAGGTGDIAFRAAERQAQASVPPSATSTPICSTSRKPGRDAPLASRFPSSKAMPSTGVFRRSLFSTPTPSHRYSQRAADRMPRCRGHIACCGLAAGFYAWNSPPSVCPGLDALYASSRSSDPAARRAVTGDAESYNISSNRSGNSRGQCIAEMIRDVGFSGFKVGEPLRGIVALHSGWRL